MQRTIKQSAIILSEAICIVVLLLCSLKFYRNKNKVIFGSSPIKQNKYWSNALNETGKDSITFMSNYFKSINSKDDYDLYFKDVIPLPIRYGLIGKYFYHIFVWRYLMQHAAVVVMPFNGFSFKNSIFWRIEHYLFKFNAIKTVLLPYGSDSYAYSRVKDPLLQHALLISYPQNAKREAAIANRVSFWCDKADFIITGFCSPDGFSRWDMVLPSYVQIDETEWIAKKHYSSADGIEDEVTVLHTPNHRGFKGTEYLVQAVEELQNEGFKINLKLLENVQNSEVKTAMQHADILAEQFIATAYGLNGVEGMASGLPVMANLENSTYVDYLKYFSFLGECPVYSTNLPILKENLKTLITKPELRKELGQLGRKYVEKYHSKTMTQYVFDAIFRKLNGEKVDTINLFHPLKSTYKIK